MRLPRLAIVSVEFEFNTDADEKYDEVVQQINSKRSELPDEIVQLDMWKWTVADMAMLQLALISEEEPFSELEKTAETLRKRVEKIGNIRRVNFYGLPDQEIHISLDFEKMALVNTSLDHISKAIASNNVNIPGGDIKLGSSMLSVKTSGSFQDLDEIRNCVVNSYQGKLIYLKDVAEVEFAYEERNYVTRYGAKHMPRAIVTMPLLTLYADLLGIVGGGIVAGGMGITPLQYISQSELSIKLNHLSVGLIKSVVFAVLIAVAGCRAGINSGRSSAAVGQAATEAVVTAIVYLIIADAAINIIFQQIKF